MRLGMVGLGRMGANLVRRGAAGGHEFVVHDISPAAIDELVGEGSTGAATLAELVELLPTPRTIWIMLPAAVVDTTVTQLAPLLARGDTLIDGGNSFYRDDVRRAEWLQRQGIHYVDVGTSGGVHGLDRGFCLMVGGEPEVVAGLAPLFATLAPGVAAAPRTPGLTGTPSTAEHGWLHCGPSGAGHFVKMVHNGIEYGIMAAYAEGLAVLRSADVGNHPRATDAESAPLPDAHFYSYEVDTAAVAEVWRRGSVIGSWLLDLTAAALQSDPDLASFQGNVSDSGEGRWTVQAAVDEGVPAPVLTSALFSRFSSRGNADFSDRILSAMRKEFGGHDENPVDPDAARRS
jgi:6-phosphogluconate dehydrogenase